MRVKALCAKFSKGNYLSLDEETLVRNLAALLLLELRLKWSRMMAILDMRPSF